MSSFVRSNILKARKDHRCDWCDARIPKGTYYDCTTFVGEYGFYSWRSCTRCPGYVAEAFRDSIADLTDGMTQEQFKEYMQDCHREVLQKWQEEDDNEAMASG